MVDGTGHQKWIPVNHEDVNGLQQLLMNEMNVKSILTIITPTWAQASNSIFFHPIGSACRNQPAATRTTHWLEYLRLMLSTTVSVTGCFVPADLAHKLHLKATARPQVSCVEPCRSMQKKCHHLYQLIQAD